MLKLYNDSGDAIRYWETWDNGDGLTQSIWGAIGERGESKVLKPSLFSKPQSKIQQEIDRRMSEGYRPIAVEDHRRLLIEFAVEGHGDFPEIEKRHRLEERMNETLGWTGLGICDGGSIGSGTMEVFCYVVEFEAAKRSLKEI
jgi:hypothetical protein